MLPEAVSHHQHPPALAHHFDSLEQQREAATLGMWAFLVTEILFFGGLFTVYLVYRTWYPDAFAAASHELVIWAGTTNTAVLICSSLTMALAIRTAQTGGSKGTIIVWLLLTMALGAAFLGIKLRYEWYRDYVEGLIPGVSWLSGGTHTPGVKMFMCFYFFMTGLHALHMVVGLGILTVLVVMTARNRFSAEYYAPLEISGLYWHFVDIVWIFLFPLLYLIGGRYPGS